MANFKRMKILLLILSLLVVTSCEVSRNHENTLTGSWVAFRTDGFNTDSYWSKDGYIFEFNDGVLNINHIFSDSSLTQLYTISDSTIILDDSTILHIYQTFSDSIKLIFDNESLVTFRKLPFTNSKKYQINEEELLKNSWLYSSDNYSQRIEFLNREWSHHNDATYECYTHELEDTLYYDSYSNKWRIFQYKNRTYFVRTFSMHYGLLHELTNLTSDTIYTKAWIGSEFSYPFLIKIEKAPQTIINNITTTLSNKTRKVKEVDYFSNNFPEWKKRIVAKRINLAAYNGEMKFDFTKDSLTVFNNDSTTMRSSWSLTNDGKYIVLNTENQTHFVEIVNYSDTLITLKNKTAFTYLMSLFNFNEIEFTITLK